MKDVKLDRTPLIDLTIQKKATSYAMSKGDLHHPGTDILTLLVGFRHKSKLGRNSLASKGDLDSDRKGLKVGFVGMKLHSGTHTPLPNRKMGGAIFRGGPFSPTVPLFFFWLLSPQLQPTLPTPTPTMTSRTEVTDLVERTEDFLKEATEHLTGIDHFLTEATTLLANPSLDRKLVSDFYKKWNSTPHMRVACDDPDTCALPYLVSMISFKVQDYTKIQQLPPPYIAIWDSKRSEKEIKTLPDPFPLVIEVVFGEHVRTFTKTTSSESHDSSHYVLKSGDGEELEFVLNLDETMPENSAMTFNFRLGDKLVSSTSIGSLLLIKSARFTSPEQVHMEIYTKKMKNSRKKVSTIRLLTEAFKDIYTAWKSYQKLYYEPFHVELIKLKQLSRDESQVHTRESDLERRIGELKRQREENSKVKETLKRRRVEIHDHLSTLQWQL